MTLEKLEAVMAFAKTMKATPKDVLWLHYEQSAQKVCAYLIVGNNYIRSTYNNIPDIILDFVENFINLEVVNFVLSNEKGLPPDKYRTKVNKTFNKCYIEGIGLLVYDNQSSVCSHIAYRAKFDLMNVYFKYREYIENGNNNRGSMAIYNYFDIANTDENWNYINSLKATDGAKLYVVDGKFPMYIFNGLIPNTKSDRINLTIYDNRNYPYFMAVFDILKTKKGVTTGYSCSLCFYRT